MDGCQITVSVGGNKQSIFYPVILLTSSLGELICILGNRKQVYLIQWIFIPSVNSKYKYLAILIFKKLNLRLKMKRAAWASFYGFVMRLLILSPPPSYKTNPNWTKFTKPPFLADYRYTINWEIFVFEDLQNFFSHKNVGVWGLFASGSSHPNLPLAKL